MDTYIISRESNISIPQEANVIYFEDGLNFGPLSNEFYYVDKSLAPTQKKSIIEHLGLFANITTLQKDDTRIVLVSGVNNIETSYATSTSGSIAKDCMMHATLDVEKVARIAYEKTSAKY